MHTASCPSADASAVAAGDVERAARNHELFREVNARIAELHGWFDDGSLMLVCECSRSDCTESVEIGEDDYEAVRGDGERFVVVPGHELPEVEVVVEQHPRFLVVEEAPRRTLRW